MLRYRTRRRKWARLSIEFCLIAALFSGCNRTSAEEHLIRAESLIQGGKIEEAREEFAKAAGANPEWRYRLVRAELLLGQSDAKAAAPILEGIKVPDEPALRARWILDRGHVSYLLADYRGAESLLRQALNLAGPLNDPGLAGRIHVRLGVALVRLGRYDEAEATLREALKLASTAGEIYSEASAMGNLGLVFQNQNHYDEAIRWFEKARAAFEHVGASVAIARTIGNLGWCYDQAGDYEKALASFQKAESFFSHTGNRFEQQTWLGKIAWVHEEQGDHAAAAENYQKALAVAREIGDRYWTGVWLGDLALVRIQTKEFDSAERLNAEAAQFTSVIGDPAGFAVQLRTGKIAKGRGQLLDAEKLFRALRSKTPADPGDGLDAERSLAETLAQENLPVEADVQFRTALAAIEPQRLSFADAEQRFSFLGSLIDFYDSYIQFLVGRGENDRALEVAEMSRSKVLDERLQSKKLESETAASASATSLQTLSRRADALLLAYWLGEDRSFVWAVTPGKTTMYTLPRAREIAPLVGAYRSFIEDLRDPLESEFAAGRKLSQILLGPVRVEMAQATRVILVPDRSLYSLNFDALFDPRDTSHYLIDRVTLSVAPSLSVLAGNRAPAPLAGRSALLIGDPALAVEDYPKLPFAAREISQIQGALANGKSIVIDGPQASPSAYQEAAPERFALIHFAAHAAANRESPLDSALILSRDAKGYQLSARQIMNVPLRARLVTLSACRSAGARTYSGEGSVGLSWAFLRAGAQSVIAGLWDVTDSSTASLMTDLYTQLGNGMTPADALRHAKLSLIHSKGVFRKPFYWAPFQLYVAGI